MVNNHLVGGWPSPLKNMSSSVGMVKSQLGSWLFPIYGEKMFQTTNQILMKIGLILMFDIYWSLAMIKDQTWRDPIFRWTHATLLRTKRPNNWGRPTVTRSVRTCCQQIFLPPLHPDAVNGSSNPQARSPSQKYSLRSCSAMSSPSLANDSSSKTLNRNHTFPSVKPISWGCTSTIIHPC